MDDTARWLPRQAAPMLAQALAQARVVCLLGPRQCGKSALAQRLAPRRASVPLDDPALLAAAAADPGGFVAGLRWSSATPATSPPCATSLTCARC